MLLGQPYSEAMHCPLSLAYVLFEEKQRQSEIESGARLNWNPDAVSGAPDLTPAHLKSLFLAYGQVLGGSPEWAEKEFARQEASGGYGPMPWEVASGETT